MLEAGVTAGAILDDAALDATDGAALCAAAAAPGDVVVALVDGAFVEPFGDAAGMP